MTEDLFDASLLEITPRTPKKEDDLFDASLLKLPMKSTAQKAPLSLPESQDTELFDAALLEPARPPVLDSGSQFPLGFETGLFGAQRSLGGGIAIVGSLPGLGFLKDLGDDLSESGRRRLESLPQPNQPDIVALWDKIQRGEGSASDVSDWLAYNLGQAGPSIAASLTGAAVGTAIAGPPGGFVGAGSISYLLNAGEVYTNLRDQGYDRPGAAALAGVPMALLDIITPTRFMGRTVWRPSNLLKGPLTKALIRTGKEGLVSFGSEALTEAAQEVIGAGTESYITGNDFFTPETLSRVLNAFAAGGLAGGALGAGGQFYSEIRPKSSVLPANSKDLPIHAPGDLVFTEEEAPRPYPEMTPEEEMKFVSLVPDAEALPEEERRAMVEEFVKTERVRKVEEQAIERFPEKERKEWLKGKFLED